MVFSRSVSVLIAVSLVPAVAAAQAQDPVKLAERLNKKAMEDYDLLEFESARQTLQSALNKLREEGQDETRTAAKVYVSLGMVYISGFKDRSRGVQQFVEALKIDGTTELDPERATPELQDAFDEARRKVPRAAGKPGRQPPPPPPDETVVPPPDETPETAPGGGLQHNSVDEAKAGQDVNIDATMGADVQATRLFLFYRGGGQDDFQSAPMTKGPRGRWTGQIPGEAVMGKTVQYYLEARDSKNRPVTAAGSAASPFLITVIQPERGSLDEHPLSVKCGKDDPLCDENKKVRDRKAAQGQGRGYGRLFFNLMVGTGAGLELQGNKFDVAWQYRNPDGTRFDATGKTQIGYYRPLTVGGTGFALSPLHGALELGVNINGRMAISGILRLEATLLNNADSSSACPTPENPNSAFGCTTKVSVAPAGMARFRYNFLEGRFRPAFHLGVGGGYIRHVLDVTEAGNHGNDPKLTDSGTADFYDKSKVDPKGKAQNFVCPTYPDTCYDTIGIGFLLGAVGISLNYDLTTWKNGGFGLILDTDVQFAFGDQFGINFDVQAGIGAHFQ